MEDGWRWKAGSQDHRSCQLEICHNLFLPSRHSAKLLARQRSCLSRKSQVPETYVLHFTAMCCLQQTLTSSRIRNCETCQVPCFFARQLFVWPELELSESVLHGGPAVQCSTSFCQHLQEFRCSSEMLWSPSAPSVSSPLPELLVEEGWASHASNKSTFSDISPWGPAQLSLTSLPMTQRIPKASHIFPPCQGALEDLKALQPVHSILPSCAQGISRNIIRIFQDVYVSWGTVRSEVLGFSPAMKDILTLDVAQQAWPAGLWTSLPVSPHLHSSTESTGPGVPTTIFTWGSTQLF